MGKWMMGLVVLGLVGSLQAAIIPNGDFEASPFDSGWSVYSGSCAMTEWVGTLDGSKGVFLTKTSSGANEGIMSGAFAMEPEINNSGYDFAVDVAAGNMGTWSAWSALIDCFDASNQWVGTLYPTGSLRNTGWTTVTSHIDDLPTGTANCKVALRLEYASPGWVIYDNVKFGATVPEPMSIGLLLLGGLILRRRM